MYGFNILVAQYVEFENFEYDNVSFLIKVPQDSVNDQKILDPGLLTAIVDTFSSFAGAALFKEEKLQMGISVSMNIKINSFDEMYLNQTYRMKVHIKNFQEKEKLIFYDIPIYDEKGKLVKQATHLKKLVKARF
jgi:hypothetical protein